MNEFWIDNVLAKGLFRISVVVIQVLRMIEFEGIKVYHFGNDGLIKFSFQCLNDGSGLGLLIFRKGINSGSVFFSHGMAGRAAMRMQVNGDQGFKWNKPCVEADYDGFAEPAGRLF